MVYRSGSAETAVVDVHTHVVPRVIYEAARTGRSWHGITFELTESGKLAWELQGRDFVLPWVEPGQTPAERLAVLDAMGVDAHVVSLSPTMWYWYHLEPARAAAMARAVNEAIAEFVAHDPRRFYGLAFVPLQAVDAATTELEFALSELGLAGVAVGTNVGGLDWDAPELFPVLEIAAAAEAMVFFHPANGRFPGPGARYHLRNVIGNPLETTLAAASMIYGGVFDRLPELRAVLAHGGGYACYGLGRMDHAYRVRPESSQMSGLPSDYARQFYWDSLTHSHRALRFLLDEAGPDRVVLGTDYPADMSQQDPVAWVRGAPELADGDRHAVLGQNARALLGKRWVDDDQ